MKVVYYSQEDPRWASIMYSNHNDRTQTIGASACGPTSAAMAISTLTGQTLLPPTAAGYAMQYGYRTYNDGTAWGYFADIAKHYGVQAQQVATFDEAKAALVGGNLVVATMRPGHFTGGGHYVLLTSYSNGYVEVYDPNQDNHKYGNDGLVDQGVRDDGIVKAKESVIRNEAGQYWIFTNPPKEDEPMTKEEKVAFDALVAKVTKLESNASMKCPSWAESAVTAAKKAGIIDTADGGSYDFYRVLTVFHRKGLI